MVTLWVTGFELAIAGSIIHALRVGTVTAPPEMMTLAIRLV